MLAWLTKNNIPSGRVEYVLSLPDDETWRADFLGALFLLTQPQNWELDQGLIPQQMADEWQDVFDDFLNLNGDIVLDSVTTAILRLTGTGESTLASTTHPMQIGATSGLNVIADSDEIQARNNSAVSQLNLNPHGGIVSVGGVLNAASFLRALITAATTLAGGPQAFQTGLTASTNLAIDTTGIQARSNGAAATLNLNPLGGVVKISQPSTTAAIPPLHLKQADLSEELIRFDAPVSSGNPINTTGLGAYYGRVRVYVEGVGFKWLALYD